MNCEHTGLATHGREGNAFQSGDKVSSFPSGNSWAFQGNFLPNTFSILYYDRLHFLLQRDLLELQLDPGHNKRNDTNCLKHLDS